MKKIIVALMLSLSIGLVPSAKAAVDPVSVLILAGFVAGTQMGKPVPFYLTDACKAQVIQQTGANYSYSSYEHCLNK